MKKLITAIIAFVSGLSFATAPVMATSNPAAVFGDEVPTAVITSCKDDDGRGSSILCLLKKVVDILSVVIGVVGAIGITIVGIQYLTAGGNEEQTRKAKRRLFEIIIGIAVYALISALLNFLLPTYQSGG